MGLPFLQTADTITATSFVKSSGTSSQFLKADGSSDSSTYLTAASLSTYATLASPTFTGTVTLPWSSTKLSGSVSWQVLYPDGSNNLNSNSFFTVANSTWVVSIANTVASTAYTNGALVITGGLGISGATYTNGDINRASYWAITTNNGGGAVQLFSSTKTFVIENHASFAEFIVGTTSNHDWYMVRNSANFVWFLASQIAFAEGINLGFGSTTGSQIGTNTGTKLGFWGTTPAVRQTPSAALATRTAAGTYGGTEQTMLQEAHDMSRTLAVSLRTVGLIT